MTARPVVPRTLANRDIEEVIAYSLGEESPSAALGFIDALEQAYVHIGVHPATGSARYAHWLNLPCLRFWPLTGDFTNDSEYFRDLIRRDQKVESGEL